MEHFKKFSEIVLNSIRETFLAEGFSERKVNKYMDNCGSVKYTKTHDSSILGHLNSLTIDMTWEIEEHIPSEKINLVELNKWMGLRILNSLNYAHPIELLREEMKTLED